jgi:hypothetical protein
MELAPLVILSNHLSIHMWIVENGVCVRPRRPFYYRLLLEFEMDSNLTWIGPLTWIGCPCWPPNGQGGGCTRASLVCSPSSWGMLQLGPGFQG